MLAAKGTYLSGKHNLHENGVRLCVPIHIVKGRKNKNGGKLKSRRVPLRLKSFGVNSTDISDYRYCCVTNITYTVCMG